MELWLAPREIDFRLDSILFVLKYFKEDRYPPEPSGYTDTRSKSIKVPSMDWNLIKAEVSLRLGLTPYKCTGIYRNRFGERTVCKMRELRCKDLACWQLHPLMGENLIYFFAGTNKEYGDLAKAINSEMKYEALDFIASGHKHRHQFIYHWRQDRANQWKAKRLKELK
jgi:hypothetical protein